MSPTPSTSAPHPREARLRFERGDTRGGRIGDARDAHERNEEFPPERVREAGRTAAAMPDGEITADDLSPETLLDSEPSRTPHARDARTPADTALRTVNAAQIGAGDGLDEAECADLDPVGRKAAAATRRKAQRHARDPNMVEPHEAAEQAAAARQRAAQDGPG